MFITRDELDKPVERTVLVANQTCRLEPGKECDLTSFFFGCPTRILVQSALVELTPSWRLACRRKNCFVPRVLSSIPKPYKNAFWTQRFLKRKGFSHAQRLVITSVLFIND